MKKVIKRYGNSYVIKLSPDEIRIYDLEEGDFVDIEMMRINKDKGGDQ